MANVYVVFYDNGMDYEDHHISADSVFLNEIDAENYAKQKNEKEHSLFTWVLAAKRTTPRPTVSTPCPTATKDIAKGPVALNGILRECIAAAMFWPPIPKPMMIV